VNLWKAIGATLVIFITGVVTGGLLVIHAYHVAQQHPGASVREASRPPGASGQPVSPRDPNRLPNPASPGSRPRLGLTPDFLQRLDAEVRLTAGQRERIEQIITEGQQRNKELWDRVAPEIRRENADTLRRIREALLPEQVARFEELMKQGRPAGRRADESLPPNLRPRDPRRPLLPREPGQPPAPAPNP
jgi:hypothetical protein